MPYCPGCGFKYDANPKFCSNCGHDLERGRPHFLDVLLKYLNIDKFWIVLKIIRFGLLIMFIYGLCFILNMFIEPNDVLDFILHEFYLVILSILALEGYRTIGEDYAIFKNVI